MGNWNINIQGVGCHHNKRPDIDADLQTAEFVKSLKAAGHTIQHATFTCGSAERLHPIQRTTEQVAAGLYTAYCAEVGGKAFNGDPLPTWEVFSADPTKKKQADAWLHVARISQRD